MRDGNVLYKLNLITRPFVGTTKKKLMISFYCYFAHVMTIQQEQHYVPASRLQYVGIGDLCSSWCLHDDLSPDTMSIHVLLSKQGEHVNYTTSDRACM